MRRECGVDVSQEAANTSSVRVDRLRVPVTATKMRIRRWAVIVAVTTMPPCIWAGCSSGSTQIVYVPVESEGGTDGSVAEDAPASTEDANNTQAQDAGTEDGEAGLPPGWCGNASGPGGECQFATIQCPCAVSGFKVVCAFSPGEAPTRPNIDGCAYLSLDASSDELCCPPGCIHRSAPCGMGLPPHLYSCATFADGGPATPLPSPGCVAGPSGGSHFATGYCCP